MISETLNLNNNPKLRAKIFAGDDEPIANCTPIEDLQEEYPWLNIE